MPKNMIQIFLSLLTVYSRKADDDIFPKSLFNILIRSWRTYQVKNLTFLGTIDSLEGEGLTKLKERLKRLQTLTSLLPRQKGWLLRERKASTSIVSQLEKARWNPKESIQELGPHKKIRPKMIFPKKTNDTIRKIIHCGSLSHPMIYPKISLPPPTIH